MKDLTVVVYTMKHCPHCKDFKELLEQEGIEYYDRDIDDNEEEYELFSEITKNDMVPAMMIIEGSEDSHESFLYAPENDYNELTEAVDIIKEHKKKLNII
jgi:glutaredoxin